MLLAETAPVNDALPILNLVTNGGAFALLGVIVLWLGPKLFKDWTSAHREVGAKIEATADKLIADDQKHRDASQVNILAFVQREKESFDRREERMYQMLDRHAAAAAEAMKAQTAALNSLREAITAVARGNGGHKT